MNSDSLEHAVPFVGVEERDEQGKAIRFVCPCHPGTNKGKRTGFQWAEVSLLGTEGRTLRMRCEQRDTGANAGKVCPASLQSRSVCFHCLASLAIRAEEAGYTAMFSGKEDEAKLAGDVYTIVCGMATTYMVLRRSERKVVKPMRKAVDKSE